MERVDGEGVRISRGGMGGGSCPKVLAASTVRPDSQPAQEAKLQGFFTCGSDHSFIPASVKIAMFKPRDSAESIEYPAHQSATPFVKAKSPPHHRNAPVRICTMVSDVVELHVGRSLVASAHIATVPHQARRNLQISHESSSSESLSSSCSATAASEPVDSICCGGAWAAY